MDRMNVDQCLGSIIIFLRIWMFRTDLNDVMLGSVTMYSGRSFQVKQARTGKKY